MDKRKPAALQFDEGRKEKILKVAGIALVAIAAYALLACISYLFSWKQDMSLLSDPSMLSIDHPSSGASGKFGFLLGHFLVCKCFGLGSFALVVALLAAGLRLLSFKWSQSMLKTAVLALSFALVSSFALALVASVIGPDNAFGGGLGGRMGAFAASWSINLFGTVPSLILAFALVVLWMFACGFRLPALKQLRHGDDGEDDPGEPADIMIEDIPEIENTPVPARDTVAPEAVKPAPEKAPEGGIEVIRDDKGLSTVIKQELPRIDTRDELSKYEFPPLEILDAHASSKQEVSSEELTRNNNKIRASLADYRIQVEDVKAVVGPTVTLYKVYPSPGVKISSIKTLQDDLAMKLNAHGVRIVTLSDSVGIEVANDRPAIVPLRALLNDPAFRESKAELPVAIGYTITQKVKVFDLATAPHLLVAGATQQGKSVGLNVLVSSLLFSKHPSELKFVFIDPKMVEFSSYSSLIKHYLAVLPDAGDEQQEKNASIVKKSKDAERILRSLCIEMDERYELMSRAGANNIKLYNEKYKDRHLLPTEGHKFLPYLVTIIDEYADLTMSVGASPEVKASSKSIQSSIIRLAQKGRAAGIHVVLATQRPSVDVISGIIKTNFPTRIAFRVASRVDSMTILDMPGAEKLIGKGDMLYYAGVECERIQCGFVSNREISAITGFIGSQQGYKKSYNTPYYLPDPAPAEGEGGGMVDMGDLDDRFVEAATMVVTSQKGSTSDLQRRLGMGYAKAGRVMDQLEAAGIVGPQEGSKPRQVLVQDLDTLQEILNAFKK